MKKPHFKFSIQFHLKTLLFWLYRNFRLTLCTVEKSCDQCSCRAVDFELLVANPPTNFRCVIATRVPRNSVRGCGNTQAEACAAKVKGR